MNITKFIGKFAFAVAMMFSFFDQSAFAAATASGIAGESTIVIKTCDYDAGAVCSLTWGGKQFVNDYDHGRQCQSAVSFDGQGEYLNPTEAGASVFTDGVNPHASSSISKIQWGSGNHIVTQTQMAYWYPVNGVKVSNVIHTKDIVIGGLPDMPHVIQWKTWYALPAGETHTFATFEALTCYLPPEFNTFTTLNWTRSVTGDRVATQWFTAPLSDGPGEQPKPIIIMTSSGSHAIGIFSPDSPQKTYIDAGYGRWRFGDTTKWNNVFRIANPHTGATYGFRSYVIVGNITEVMDNMEKLMYYFNMGPQ